MEPKPLEYRSIKRKNQLILPNGVPRRVISLGISEPILARIKKEPVAAGKSQALVINELLEAGLKTTEGWNNGNA